MLQKCGIQMSNTRSSIITTNGKFKCKTIEVNQELCSWCMNSVFLGRRYRRIKKHVCSWMLHKQGKRLMFGVSNCCCKKRPLGTCCEWIKVEAALPRPLTKTQGLENLWLAGVLFSNPMHTVVVCISILNIYISISISISTYIYIYLLSLSLYYIYIHIYNIIVLLL